MDNLRRSIAAKVILSPSYRKLSMGSQSLYINLIMNADEYGFVDNAYKFLSENGYKIEDLGGLTKNNFVLLFPNDAMLIAHWYIHTNSLIDMSPDRTYEYSFTTLDFDSAVFIENDKMHEAKNKTKKKDFVPPTRQEVREYAQSRNSNVDPDDFYDFFSTPNENGDCWVDTNGKRVVNWKGKFVTWEKFRAKEAPKKNGRISKVADKQSASWNIRYDVDGTEGDSST